MSGAIMNTSQVRQLQSDLETVVSDAEALLKETASEGGASLSNVRDRLAESLAMVRERALEVGQATRAGTRAAARSTDRYVRDNPWQTIGIAAAAGVLIGVLIG